MKAILCDICGGKIINGDKLLGIGEHLHIKAYKFRNNDGHIIKGKNTDVCYNCLYHIKSMKEYDERMRGKKDADKAESEGKE